jgi:hypothetical protein
MRLFIYNFAQKNKIEGEKKCMVLACVAIHIVLNAQAIMATTNVQFVEHGVWMEDATIPPSAKQQ